MFATLFSVVIAIAIGHLAPSAVVRLRRFEWFDAWLLWVHSQLAGTAGWTGALVMCVVLLPALAIVPLQWAFNQPWLGLFELLFGAIVLLYTWGPRDLDSDVRAFVHAESDGERHQPLAALASHDTETARVEVSSLVFRNARVRWFGPLFWFLLLGPFGALFYRLTAIAAQHGRPPQEASQIPGATTLHAVLDWPIDLLLSLSLALVGNFDRAAAAWREAGASWLELRSTLLDTLSEAIVAGALSQRRQDELEAMLLDDSGHGPQATEAAEAMNLAWRCLLLWLALLALFVLAGWVG